MCRIVPAFLGVFVWSSLFMAATLRADEPAPFPGKAADWEGFSRFQFVIEGIPATVVAPKTPVPGRPWIWRGEFFGAFAAADAAMVKEGWHLAYAGVPDLFGSPKAIKQWEVFHKELTGKYGLHGKPGLIGLSRGGLYCMNWAAAHPEKTLAVYLDNAVCDFKSWPGGKLKNLGTGAGSAEEWKKVLKAYDFASDKEAIDYPLNPVDNLKALANAKIPLLLVYGDKDRVVPHAENSEIVWKRYRELNSPVEQIVKPGQDHHPHGLTDVTPVVTFFQKAWKTGR